MRLLGHATYSDRVIRQLGATGEMDQGFITKHPVSWKVKVHGRFFSPLGQSHGPGAGFGVQDMDAADSLPCEFAVGLVKRRIEQSRGILDPPVSSPEVMKS